MIMKIKLFFKVIFLLQIFLCSSFLKNVRHSRGNLLRRAKGYYAMRLHASIRSEKSNPSSDSELLDIEDEGLPINFRSGFISILGNPNVGKSSLLNGILQSSLSIVTPKPQTTQQNILGILTDDHYQMVFTDTPGMPFRSDKLAKHLTKSIHTAVDEASDVVLLVTDVTEDKPFHDQTVLEKLRENAVPTIVVINKIDLYDRQTSSTVPLKPLEILHSQIRALYPDPVIVDLSAKERIGFETLIQNITRLLPRGPKYYPDEYLSDQDERFFVTEFVREAIFELFNDEVPYATHVNLQAFEDRHSGVNKELPVSSRIKLEILVPRNSMIPIFVGREGEQIHRLRVRAKAKIEKFLQRPVHLEIKVSKKHQ